MSQLSYDGDYTQAVVAGPPEFEIPFKDDPKEYIYKLPYWQFLNSVSEPALDEPGPLGGFYVGKSSGASKTIGGGVVEFRREYALVPDTRSEHESFVYSYQIILVGGQGGITEMPTTTQSRLQLDYFHTSDPSSIDLPKAGRAFQLQNTIYMLHGFCDTVLHGTTGQEILAQDATYKRWKGNIYERQQRFVEWISIADLFANSDCGA